MNFKKSLPIIFSTCLFFSYACNDNDTGSAEKDSANTENATSGNANEKHGNEIKPGDVSVTTPLNQEWVTAGKGIYDLKCQSCHKLTDERVVGPGWAGVTQRREPH